MKFFKFSVVSLAGITFMLIGTVFLLNSVSNITGLVILDEIDSGQGSTVGAILVLIGALLLISTRTKESKLVSLAGVEINLSKGFLRDIRNHDKLKIESALFKIGTNQGHEHRLVGGLAGRYSINVGKTGRIVYEWEDHNHTEATVISYLPDHNYKRAKRRVA